MAKPKKTAPKSIADVAHPGKSAPSDTSKPIITPRPIMKDPMVVAEDPTKKPEEEPQEALSKRTSKLKIMPLDEPAADSKTADVSPESDVPDSPETGAGAETETPEKPSEKLPEESAKLTAEPEETASQKETKGQPEEKPPKPAVSPKSDDSSQAEKPAKPDKKSRKPAPDAEAAEQAERDAKLQKLIDNKKYFLPINAVEQRRNTRYALLGVILVLVLAIAWADVALDAGLIHIDNVKPVTHFFSN